MYTAPWWPTSRRFSSCSLSCSLSWRYNTTRTVSFVLRLSSIWATRGRFPPSTHAVPTDGVEYNHYWYWCWSLIVNTDADHWCWCWSLIADADFNADADHWLLMLISLDADRWTDRDMERFSDSNFKNPKFKYWILKIRLIMMDCSVVVIVIIILKERSRCSTKCLEGSSHSSEDQILAWFTGFSTK